MFILIVDEFGNEVDILPDFYCEAAERLLNVTEYDSQVIMFLPEPEMERGVIYEPYSFN